MFITIHYREVEGRIKSIVLSLLNYVPYQSQVGDWFHAILISPADGGEWSASQSGCFTQGEKRVKLWFLGHSSLQLSHYTHWSTLTRFISIRYLDTEQCRLVLNAAPQNNVFVANVKTKK
jgi:hypothetical protein